MIRLKLINEKPPKSNKKLRKKIEKFVNNNSQFLLIKIFYSNSKLRSQISNQTRVF